MELPNIPPEEPPLGQAFSRNGDCCLVSIVSGLNARPDKIKITSKSSTAYAENLPERSDFSALCLEEHLRKFPRKCDGRLNTCKHRIQAYRA